VASHRQPNQSIGGASVRIQAVNDLAKRTDFFIIPTGELAARAAFLKFYP